MITTIQIYKYLFFKKFLNYFNHFLHSPTHAIVQSTYDSYICDGSKMTVNRHIWFMRLWPNKKVCGNVSFWNTQLLRNFHFLLFVYMALFWESQKNNISHEIVMRWMRDTGWQMTLFGDASAWSCPTPTRHQGQGFPRYAPHGSLFCCPLPFHCRSCVLDASTCL